MPKTSDDFQVGDTVAHTVHAVIVEIDEEDGVAYLNDGSAIDLIRLSKVYVVG